jgi:hemerythrin-like domain-containing protein
MAFKLFGKKKKKKALQDIEGNILQVGDKVDCMRYEMGESILLISENGYEYESVKNGQKVSYAKMIDAATSFQKVRKLN